MKVYIIIECVKMPVKLKTEWMDVHIELQKTLRGFEFSKYDKKKGVVDYLSVNDEEKRRLLRVFVSDKLKADKVDVRSLEETIGSKEYEKFDQVQLLAKGFTVRSKDLIRSEEFLSGLTENNRTFSVPDIRLAIQNVSQELCTKKCGSYPQRESDCRSLAGGVYTCDIRRISDDADFHARMGWLQLLYGDYKDLLLIKREKGNN